MKNTYQNQPFKKAYSIEDLEVVEEILYTLDRKYSTFIVHNGFYYWKGSGCYPDISYGYFFFYSNCLQNAVDNLNKTLDDKYEFNPLIYDLSNHTASF